MERAKYYKEIMEKLMKKPFDDEEMESMGKKGPVLTISVMSDDEDEAGEEKMEKMEDEAQDKRLIEEELKKRGIGNSQRGA